MEDEINATNARMEDEWKMEEMPRMHEWKTGDAKYKTYSFVLNSCIRGDSFSFVLNSCILGDKKL